jgi:allantoicase
MTESDATGTAGTTSGEAVGTASGEAAAPAVFTALPDLAARRLGGSVVFASDELFAAKENLIKPTVPVFTPGEFGSKGKVYDGWETRRRRDHGHDHAIVRLGCSGIIHGVVVDTAFFRGNYPPEISIEAACADGYPSPAELADLPWFSLVDRAAVAGDSASYFPVADPRRWTHVRLSIFPDGGVARLRVHGQVVPDPAFLAGTVDLAATENGGLVLGCSDAFYSAPANLISPGRAADMGDGWENARRRGPGNDYVIFQLTAAGRPGYAEVDTSCFVGNAPGWVKLLAADARTAPAGELTWREILPETRVQPDTRHRFLIDSPPAATHLRLDVIPDGGLARLRLLGEIEPDALAALSRRWLESAPD